MKRMLWLAFFAGSVLCVPAQEKKGRTLDLWGHVKSAYIKQGILGARVTLMTEDSTVVDTMTVFQEWHGDNKIDAAYKFVIPAERRKYIIRAEHPDYETLDVNFSVPPIGRNTLFEATYHFMKPRRRSQDLEGGTLGEVVVSKTRVKVFSRGDTIVYNADAFKLPEGSMLDDLIRQMPGAELKDDGQIFINGEKIDELTLNGKDFFGGKTKVMLENLPYYTVNQLKVYHKSSERSEWLGREVERKKHVMDVVLKRQYAAGTTGNAELGGGTSALWLARLFALRYTNNSRLAVYGNANNINQSTRPMLHGNNGYWGTAFGSGRTQFQTVGADLLVDDADKKWQDNLSCDATWNKHINTTRRSTEQYLANGGSTFNRFASNEQSHNFNVGVANKFKTEDPKNPWHTHANTEFRFSQRDSHGSDLAAQTDADPDTWGSVEEMLDSAFATATPTALRSILINRSRTQAMSDGRTVRGKGDFGVYRKTAWGDDGGLNFRIEGTHMHDNAYSQQRVDYFQSQGDGTQPADPLQQNRYTQGHPNYTYQYAIAPYYSFNLLRDWTLYTDYTYSQHFTSRTSETFLLDRLAGYDAQGNALGTLPSTRDSLLLALDLNNTNRQTAMNRTHAYAVALSRSHTNGRKSYTWFRLYLTGRYFSNRLHYASQPADTVLTQHRLTIEPDVELTHRRYAPSDSTYSREYYAHYKLTETLPSLANQVNVSNDLNPLYVRRGNPSLRGPVQHTLALKYGRTRNRPYTHWGVDMNLTLHRNSISQGYTYTPATGVYTYRPENVNGNWQFQLRTDRNGSLGHSDRLSYNAAATLGYEHNVDYASLAGQTASTLSHVNNYTLTTYGSATWRLNQLELTFMANVNARHATQQEGYIADVNAADFNYGLTADWQLPLSFRLTNTLRMNSRRGYSDASFNRDEFIWNLTLSRPLLKKRLTARLECTDILHNQSSIYAYVNGQGRTEVSHNHLPSFAMLTLQYNFQRFPKHNR